MNASLMNHSELCAALQNGETEYAIDLFLNKTKEVTFTSSARNTYLSSLNFSIYNYILLKEHISLHECCLKNEKKILQSGGSSVEELGIEIIQTYGYDTRTLSVQYDNPHIKAAVSYIQQNLDRPLSLTAVSEAVSVNASYLCQLFRKETGMSFTEYILSCRCRQAYTLLKNSDHSIQEIAIRCGFKSASYFSTCYKKATGKLPSQDQRRNTAS